VSEECSQDASLDEGQERPPIPPLVLPLKTGRSPTQKKSKSRSKKSHRRVRSSDDPEAFSAESAAPVASPSVAMETASSSPFSSEAVDTPAATPPPSDHGPFFFFLSHLENCEAIEIAKIESKYM
jgi:hypothetical protein